MPGPYAFPTDRVVGGPAPADDANAFGAAFNEADDAATPNVLMLRDAAGRAQVADPSAAADVATKGYVDGRTPASSTGASGIVELATTTETQTMTDAVRAVTPAGLAAAAVSAATANRIVRRDASGRAAFATPSASGDAATKGYVDGLLGKYVGINAQVGTTYTPVLADVGKLVTLTNAAAITVTLPQDSDVAVPITTSIDFVGLGAGLATFVAGTGATVVGTPSLVARAQYSVITAIKIAANTWLLAGDLA